jgi:bacterioferritin (cytochrome b1)
MEAERIKYEVGDKVIFKDRAEDYDALREYSVGEKIMQELNDNYDLEYTVSEVYDYTFKLKEFEDYMSNNLLARCFDKTGELYRIKNESKVF